MQEKEREIEYKKKTGIIYNNIKKIISIQF